MNQGRPQTIIEKMTDSWYNFRYILLTYLSGAESRLPRSNIVYILGKQIQLSEETLDVFNIQIKENIEQLRTIVRRTLWMTYRRNFAPLLGTSYISDTGWGCMIRAGQMVVAQMIKKHLKNFGDRRDLEMDNITQAFADNDGTELEQLIMKLQSPETVVQILCPFSIQKIAFLAQKEFSLQPGEWYKPNYILYILESLHNTLPIRGSEQLKMIVFNDSSIFLDELTTKLDKSNSLAIFVLTRIGLDYPNPDYLKVLDKIMEMPTFQGIVGGSPQRALYILGRIADQYIYLDPHYVQEATTREQIIMDQETFSCQNIHLINQKNVDTSMGLSFYVRNAQELDQFWKDLQDIKQANKEHFFIYMADKKPIYDNLNNYMLQEQQNDDILIIE